MEVLVNGIIRNLDVSKELYLGTGVMGNVYKIDNETCFKYYRNKIEPIEIEPVIKEISTINLTNFSNIRALLYEPEYNEYMGYIMDYLERININIFDTDSDYLIESFYNLLEDAKKLSKHNILIWDMHQGNSMFTKDGIKVFDMDYYKLTNNDPLISNLDSVRILFYLILNKLYEKNHSIIRTYIVFNHRLKKLLDIRRSKDLVYDTNNFYKILSKYKKPIDYFGGK